MTLILGIDPSLTATGLARFDTLDRLVIDTWTRGAKGHVGDTLGQRMHRLDDLVDSITAVEADVVVIEGPSLAQKAQRGTFDRAGLWWLLVARLFSQGRTVIEVPPSTLKKYATGKGNAAKGEVVIAATRRYPQAMSRNDNEADAVVLAAMGARATGRPIDDDLPARHLEAMGAVQWPNLGRAS